MFARTTLWLKAIASRGVRDPRFKSILKREGEGEPRRVARGKTGSGGKGAKRSPDNRGRDDSGRAASSTTKPSKKHAAQPPHVVHSEGLWRFVVPSAVTILGGVMVFKHYDSVVKAAITNAVMHPGAQDVQNGAVAARTPNLGDTFRPSNQTDDAAGIAPVGEGGAAGMRAEAHPALAAAKHGNVAEGAISPSPAAPVAIGEMLTPPSTGFVVDKNALSGIPPVTSSWTHRIAAYVAPRPPSFDTIVATFTTCLFLLAVPIMRRAT